MAQRQTTRAHHSKTKKSTTKRARPRTRAQGGRPREKEIIVIRFADLILDDDWNARSFDNPNGTGRQIIGEWPEQPDRPLTDEQLIESIRINGLISPPLVRCVSETEGTYSVVAGTRRVRACLAIDPEWEGACIEQPEEKRKDEAEFAASAANLAENMNRRDLRPFEIADKLHRIKKKRPDVTAVQLAKATSVSKPYVYNLLRARRQASEQMWQIFCVHGAKYAAGVTFKDFLSIVTKHPKSKQLAAWNALIDSRTSSPSSNGASSSTPRPKALSATQLETYLAELSDPGATDFESGLRFALLVALGREQWTARLAAAAPLEGQRGRAPRKKKTNGVKRASKSNSATRTRKGKAK